MPTLQFKGKTIIWNHHLSVPYHALESDSKLSFQPEKANGNLIVEGDNLLGLKALLPLYAGQVKCIYIDPPYNTGNDNGQGKGWVYNDNVNSPLIKDWLGKEVGLDDLVRHDKWLCMITPRIKLLRELLSDDGVIFISIDDNEVYNLRQLMNEVFGEENFIALLPTVMNLKGNQDEFAFAGTHEYTLVFAKNKPKSRFYEFDINEDDIADWEEDELGPYKKGATMKASGVNAPREKRGNLFYPILLKNGENKVQTITEDEFNKIYDKETKVFNDTYIEKLRTKYEKLGFNFLLPISDDKYMSWRWQRSKVEAEPYNIIVNNEDGNITLYKKQRPSLGDLPSKKPKTIFYKPEYSSGNGTNLLKIFFQGKVFNNPKPLELIKDFIKIGSDKNSIILDSFAGSGTTAHAVLDLNKEDGGNRKFILVQMPEATPAEPKKNICKDITRERVKRAIEKYGYESGFEYMQIGVSMDTESLLSGKLPTMEQLGNYVFYLCMGSDRQTDRQTDRQKPSSSKLVTKNLYFVGSKDNTEVYLIYSQNYDELTHLALNLELAEKIATSKQKRYIVYAPACFLDEDYLRAKQIEFVNIPYGLFQRKGNDS